jgi:hypothetical protein
VEHSKVGQICCQRILSKEGVDYDETFSLVARYTSIEMVMSLSLCFGWPLYQIDVNIDFMNGMIKDEVYINRLRGFGAHG